MRLVSAFWIIIAIFVLLPARAGGIVFLNVQWNEDTEEWEAMPLVLEGDGLSLNRDYQNAYGNQMDLPPGPPFIITEGIIIRNTYDEHDEVDDWGSLGISTVGEGDEPFTLEFHPPDMGGDYSVVTVEGNLLLELVPRAANPSDKEAPLIHFVEIIRQQDRALAMKDG